MIAALLNIFLAGVLFVFSQRLIGIIGTAGAKALSKVMGLLLASIAVTMIRRGLAGV